MARQSPNGRPLVGRRLNDTAALVRNGLPKPQGCYELHYPPSAECMVTDMVSGGTRPDFSACPNPAPDPGNTFARACDYMKCK